MFKKKPQIKTLSPLRSSDRRRTADQIIKDYQLDIQPPKGDDAEAKAVATAAHTALRNSLLPDNALSAKFVTTHGPQLKQIAGTVFVGGHSSGEQRILWVKIEERLYPSVYTLWKNPGILPLVHTPSVVVQKIQGGADLMTPGLAGPPFASKKAIKGAVVAIASLEAPTVPMAVGTCEIDISTLQTTRNTKGHAVETFHWAGDELWDWSTSGKAGRPPPDSIEGWETEEFSAFMARFSGLEVDDKDEADGGEGGVPLPSDNDSANNKYDRHDDENRLVEVVDLDKLEMTTQEIDKAFHSAFLFAIHQLKANGVPPKYGLDFPLSQSAFISTFILPYLPAHTQKQAEQLVIKKTSWKNARKFIKSLEKEKLLVCREKPGNEVDVWGIDFDDQTFAEFVPYKLPRQTTNDSGEGVMAEEAKGQPADESIGQRLKKAELYKPGDGLAPLFKDSNVSSKSLLTATDLRNLLAAYVESSSLTNPSNKRLVNLDPFLSNTFFNASSPADAEALARGSAPRDALVDRLLAACASYYAILRNDDTLESVKPRAGAAPRITTTVETRGGNKRVTRIAGLEPYYISPQALAEELRKTCAGSAGTEPAKGSKGLDVTVQGPQTQAVLEALEKRGVRSQWVDVVDKTKKKK